MNDIRTEFETGWTGGLPETPCGFGSTMRGTRLQRHHFPGWFAKYEIDTVADVGAGDGKWFKSMMLGVERIALDLVPRAPEVQEFDIRTEVPPAADCVMCLWVLNHLNLREARAAWRNLLKAEAKYYLVTIRHFEQLPARLVPLECLKLNPKGDKVYLCTKT